MSVQDRLEMAKDKEMGQWLLSLLTPSQFIELFPDYYRRGLPDISGFLKAMPSSMSAAKQAAVEEQLQNTASGSAAGSNFKAGGWRKKWQEGMSEQQRATPTRAGVVPPPHLSPEQRKSFDDLKSSPMAVDDPRAKMFAGLSADQMAQVGISKYKEGGKEFFKYSAPSVSDEEVKKSLSKSEQAKSIERVADRLGIPPKDLAAVMHYESAGTMSTSKWGGTGGNYLGLIQFGPAERKQFGVYAGQPFDEQVNAAGKFLEQRGLKRWLESHPNATQEQKRIALYSTINAGSPNESNWHKSDNGGRDNVISHTQRIFREHYGAAETFMGREGSITGDYSAKSLELAREKLVRQKEEQRIGSLAEYTTASPIEQAAITSSKSNAAEALISKFNGKAFANAKGNTECAAFAQAHGVGHTSGWTPGSSLMDGHMKPGDWIALFGEGGRYTNKSGSAHTAMFVGYERDNNGKITGVKVLDQWNKRERVGISTWHPGSGGEMDPLKYHQIVDRGKPASMYSSVSELDGQTPSTPPATQPKIDSKKIVETQAPPTTQDEVSAAKRRGELPPVPTPMQPAPQVETPQVLNKPGTESASVVASPSAPAAPQAAPKPGPEKYNVNVAKFISTIKQTPDFKSNPLSWMATDSMILNGFNDDARVKAAGVYLDDKGIMHFKKGMTPEVKAVMADFDTKSFMTKIEEKKPDVKPVEKAAEKPAVKPVEQKPVEKPAEKPPVPTPNQPAPQVETPKVEAKKEKAPAAVKTNAAGGDNKVNSEQISAYPIGGLKGDNVVVVNKQQQPLFTMNTNESVTMNPKTDTATVTPNTRERKIGEANRPSPLEGMFDKFNQSVRELSGRFDANKPVPERQDSPNAFPSEGGSWLNNLNKLTENQFHSPSARRAFYRAGGGETGEPNSGFHYSKGNRS